MKNQYLINSCFIVFAFLLGVFLLLKDSENTSVIKYIKINGESVKVELALDKETQELGLLAERD